MFHKYIYIYILLNGVLIGLNFEEFLSGKLCLFLGKKSGSKSENETKSEKKSGKLKTEVRDKL